MTADVTLLTMVVSVLLPMLVALVTKQVAAGWVKSVALLALAAVTGTLTSIIESGGVFEWKAVVVSTIVSFVVAVASHYGLWRPVSVTGADGKIQNSVPGGLG